MSKTGKTAETKETNYYTAPIYQNEVRLVGYLGDNPEIFKDRAVLSLATKNSWKPKDSDEFQESTDWHRLVVWGDRAKAVKALGFAKGDYVQVEGELRSSEYEKKVEGQPPIKVKAWEVRAYALRRLVTNAKAA